MAGEDGGPGSQYSDLDCTFCVVLDSACSFGTGLEVLESIRRPAQRGYEYGDLSRRTGKGVTSPCPDESRTERCVNLSGSVL